MTDDEISEILLPLMPLKDPYVFARAIAAAEREACAKVCDEEARQFNLGDGFEDHAIGAEYCADVIRARSNADVTGLAPEER